VVIFSLSSAATGGHIKILEFLHTTILPRLNLYMAASWIADSGSLEVQNWFIQHTHINQYLRNSEDRANNAAENCS
jgi:hypothetical protein